MVTFDPGETSKNVIVPIIGDTVPEGPETLTLNLSNPQNAELASSEVTGTINDYNEAPVSLSLGDVKVVESDSGSKTAVFTATLSGPSDTATTFTASTRNGTAVSGK